MTKIIQFRFILVIFLLLSIPSFAQKVKYKDIFGLLSTKQYEQAEPFMKRYVKDNDDNPNAYLYMGMIFQEKAMKLDVLKQTALVNANSDSAIQFYDKTLRILDEREVRKNKEYYQAYNRRDLRTGEFGVNLSDVQYDIEKRVQFMKERIDKVKMVKFYFSVVDTTYKKAVKLYTSLQKENPSEKQMYLRADENTLKKLASLGQKYDSCIKAFDNYKTATSNLGRTGYNQNLTVSEISDFSAEGNTGADFFQDDVKVWNYRKFADRGKDAIEREIIPMRSHLITYDVEINKLRDKLNTDSVSVRSDLTKLIDVLLYEQLKKFDAQPLPMQVFSMKTADLEYRSVLLENKRLRDSADVHYRLALVRSEIRSLNKLDSIGAILVSSDIDTKALDYGYFISNTYSNTIVLSSYIKALKEYAEREKRTKREQLALAKEALNWIIDGADSIPLNTAVKNKRFKPLLTEPEKYAVGLVYKDSLTAEAYFYLITPSRKPALKLTFPVDKMSFRESKFGSSKALSYSDPSGQVYYVMVSSAIPSKEKFPASVAKIYRSDGLAWTNHYLLGFIPSALSFKTDTSELIIADFTDQQIAIDKNGKMLR
jgi:hypothetical protein